MAGVDLTAINGCNAATIQTVLSEIGTDMRPWATCGHFSSWLGLCPRNDISGGKVLKSRTLKTKNRANAALRLAAQGLTHSNSWLGAFYRRQKARLGAPKAITATAHKMARIIYNMLKYRWEFVDLGADHYEAQYRKRQTQGLIKKATKPGIPSRSGRHAGTGRCGSLIASVHNITMRIWSGQDTSVQNPPKFTKIHVCRCHKTSRPV